MTARLLTMTSICALCAGAATAEMNFNRIATFMTPDNMAEGADRSAETSAEIIAATADGMTLIYTDSPLGVVGLIDITDPRAPRALGNIDMGGEPTAVSVIGTTAFVAVDTSESYTDPSGVLRVVDIPTMTITATCDLGGQPDSTSPAPDGSYVAVAIENQRDEDLGDGKVPQMPAGYLVQMPVADGTADCANMRKVDVTGLAEIAPEDPEPEFVDVNSLGETAFTVQENNHLVVVDKDGTVISHFSSGTVDLTGIDATDEKAALIFDQSQPGRLREPDGLQWIDDRHFAIANEGDMDGGSRGWTIFAKDGTLVYESGTAFEKALIEIGHYPDRRSDAKGVEPEGMEFATFGGTPMVFLLSERASVMGVYDVTDPAAPVLKQLLPSGISPEGVYAIPQRNLIVTANETDLGPDGGSRASVMIYEYQDAPAAYPQLTSAGTDGLIGWGALSGLSAGEDGMIYAVNDSFYGFQPRIFTIDPSQTPARIVAALDVVREGRPAQKLDMEGIAVDGAGGFWIASEGRTDRLVPHALYHVNAKGEIKEEIGLPAELLAHEIRYGFEGIALVGDTLWMPVQREWTDDPAGMVKLVAYNTETGEWGAVHYPLTAAPQGWTGLSEIAVHGDHAYFLERDNQIGADAAIKTVTRVPLAEMVPAPLGGALPVVSKEVVRDLIPDLAGNNGVVQDKVEGMTFDADGTMWLSTDNDGVDDASGETYFWAVRDM